MKTTAALLGLIACFSILTGCASNKEEKEAYFNEGKMDEQVESWKKPGGRY